MLLQKNNAGILQGTNDIMAAKIIYEATGEKVNLITVATPVYEKKNSPENPCNQEEAINDQKRKSIRVF